MQFEEGPVYTKKDNLPLIMASIANLQEQQREARELNELYDQYAKMQQEALRLGTVSNIIMKLALKAAKEGEEVPEAFHFLKDEANAANRAYDAWKRKMVSFKELIDTKKVNLEELEAIEKDMEIDNA